MMICRTLGPVEVSLDGETVPPQLMWRKHLALLIYLARSPRGRSREQIVGLLWADRPEDAARHSLNEALRLFRRHLGDGCIEAAGALVRLAPGLVELDVDQLESFAAREQWDSAASLVAGEFLEGFAVPGASAFEDWLGSERMAWRQRSVEVLARYADSLLAGGRTSEAAAVARRAIAIDPRSGPAVRASMRALALAGERAAALEVFDRHARLLESELQSSPDAETSALALRVRRERLTRPEPVAGDPPSDRLPLAGREAELAGLLATATEARSRGTASLLLLTGESGTGKTRLLEELLGRLRLDGAGVSVARAVEADRMDPWCGVFTLARGGLLESPGLAAAPAAALRAFAEALPIWADRFPVVDDASPALPPARAFRELLRAAAEEGPLALAVDDAQWLDEESLGALAAALRDLGMLPLLVVLAMSPHPPRRELDELRTRIGRDIDGLVTALGPLGRPALHTLARQLLPRFDEVELDRVVRRVATDSAGVPLLAVELLRAVASGLDLRATEAAWPEPLKTLDQTLPGDLPDAVLAAIRIGFRRLSPTAQQVLAAAAVLGDRVAPDRLARALRLEPGSVLQALDELEWHHWLASEPRGYGFVARIVRQVVERDMLTPGQRRRILAAAEEPS